MKKAILFLILFTTLLMLNSCEVVGGIFKAGMVWGIFLVILVVGGIFYLISRGRK